MEKRDEGQGEEEEQEGPKYGKGKIVLAQTVEAQRLGLQWDSPNGLLPR